MKNQIIDLIIFVSIVSCLIVLQNGHPNIMATVGILLLVSIGNAFSYHCGMDKGMEIFKEALLDTITENPISSFKKPKSKAKTGS